MMKSTVTIIAISGSLKSTSVNTAIIKSISKSSPKNVKIELLQGLNQLPFFNPEIQEPNPALLLFREQIQKADGVLFSTPEYAFGVPGVLKNGLDWLVSSGELNEKPVAIVSISTLISGGENALASLKLTLSALGTITNISSCLAIGSVKSKMDDLGEITSLVTKQELESVLTALLENIARISK